MQTIGSVLSTGRQIVGYGCYAGAVGTAAKALHVFLTMKEVQTVVGRSPDPSHIPVILDGSVDDPWVRNQVSNLATPDPAGNLFLSTRTVRRTDATCSWLVWSGLLFSFGNLFFVPEIEQLLASIAKSVWRR